MGLVLYSVHGQQDIREQSTEYRQPTTDNNILGTRRLIAFRTHLFDDFIGNGVGEMNSQMSLGLWQSRSRK